MAVGGIHHVKLVFQPDFIQHKDFPLGKIKSCAFFVNLMIGEWVLFTYFKRIGYWSDFGELFLAGETRIHLGVHHFNGRHGFKEAKACDRNWELNFGEGKSLKVTRFLLGIFEELADLQLFACSSEFSCYVRPFHVALVAHAWCSTLTDTWLERERETQKKKIYG